MLSSVGSCILFFYFCFFFWFACQCR